MSTVIDLTSSVIRGELQSPFLLMKARLFPDGNQWCALYGDNIQEGLVGFDTNYFNQKIGGAA